MTNIPRLPNGRYPPGVSGGRQGGRRPKATDADEVIEEAFAETVLSTEGGKRKRISKARAAAKQVANEGATGRSARHALAVLQKAQQRKRETSVPVPVMRESDHEIVARFMARVRLALENTDDTGN